MTFGFLGITNKVLAWTSCGMPIGEKTALCPYWRVSRYHWRPRFQVNSQLCWQHVNGCQPWGAAIGCSLLCLDRDLTFRRTADVTGIYSKYPRKILHLCLWLMSVSVAKCSDSSFAAQRLSMYQTLRSELIRRGFRHRVARRRQPNRTQRGILKISVNKCHGFPIVIILAGRPEDFLEMRFSTIIQHANHPAMVTCPLSMTNSATTQTLVGV